MKQRLVITLAVLVLATLLQWYFDAPSPSLPADWRLKIEPLLAGLKQVLPGALVGFILGRHGILLGALVGFLGRLAVLAPLYLVNYTASSAYVGLTLALSAVMEFAIVSAAAGGAGELLRANFRGSGR